MINEPVTFFANYTAWLPWIIGFLVIQSVGSAILIVNGKRRERAEKQTSESEARFRDFAVSSADWFWEMDENLRFTYGSERLFKVFGFEPKDIYGHDRKIMVEAGLENIKSEKWLRHFSHLRNHEPFRNFEYRTLTQDDKIIHVSVSGHPLFNPELEFIGYRGTGTEITKRKLSEESLRAALTDAERANQAKSEFLATMSHEFRTPLNAILGFSEMMRAQYFGPLGSNNYEEYANDIHRSGEHMLSLVNDVLDIAAIEAGKRTMVKESIAIDEVLKVSLRNLQKAAEKDSIRLSLEISDDLPSLYADKRSVTQIFLNLLSNAIKFTEPDGTITVSAIAVDKKVIVKVSDTGIGISADRLPKITEPFSQSEADPYKAQDGTGLGLSIVEALVSAHGGKLNIESEVGEGTIVTVTFPAHATAVNY